MKKVLLLATVLLMSANAFAFHVELHCDTLQGEKLDVILPADVAILAYVNGKQVPAYDRFLPRSLDNYGNHRYTIEGQDFIFGPNLNSTKREWRMFQGTMTSPVELNCAVIEK